MKAEEILKSKLSAHWCTFIYAHPIKGDKRLKDWIIEAMEAYHQEGSTDWKTIENEFKEWDAAGGFKASQRDILDWFKDNLPVGQEKEAIIPSDEDIYVAANNNDNSTWKGHSQGYYYHFVEGAEWLRDQSKPVDNQNEIIQKCEQCGNETYKELHCRACGNNFPHYSYFKTR